MFDSRLVHHSMENMSGADRVVALCGVFPSKAEFIMCYKEPIAGSKIELIKQEENFILENDSFFYDCHSRPKYGVKCGEVENDYPEMLIEMFEKLCELNSIQKENLIEKKDSVNCQFIAEPSGENLYSGK